MDEDELRQFEKNLDESIKKAEESFQIRQDTLDGIYQELAVMNRLLGPIIREIAEMNGKTVEEMLLPNSIRERLIRTETYILNPSDK